jgi:uncharacterized protein with GYD domain
MEGSSMKYLALVKYTAEACRGLAKDGLGSRRSALEEASRAQGVTIDEFWAVDSFDWNVAFVFTAPDDQPAGVRVAQFVVSYGVGHIENSLVLPLVSTAEADAVLQTFVAAKAPGA